MNRDSAGPGDQGGYGGYYGGYYYGEGYGNYGYGGGEGGGGGGGRNIRDYLGMLRERIWWLIVTVFVVFIGTAIYTFNATPMYRATSTVQVLRQPDKATQFEKVVQSGVLNPEDFQTQIKILESISIVKRVADRLNDEERRLLMEPYESVVLSLRRPMQPTEVLFNNRRVVPVRMSLMVAIQYEHPSPELAATIANYFAEEYINYNIKQAIKRSQRAVDELQQRTNAQRQKVEQLEMELADFKEKHKTISLDAGTNIDEQEIIRLTDILTGDKKILDEAEIRWKMIQQVREEGRPLWELDFIASWPQVPELLQRLSAAKIEMAALERKYRAKHPRMIEANQALTQARTELQNAVDSAAEAVYNKYLQASENYKNSEARLATKRQQIIDLQRTRVEYNSMRRNFEVAQEMYNYFYSRMQQAMTEANDDAETAQILDEAAPPPFPHSPNIVLNLVLGLFGGTALGLGLVFLVSVMDDKVKTAFDIENVIGMPIIGIIPRITRTDPVTKARIVPNGMDKQSVEAFRVIHSTLKLNEDSKKAKVVLVTSTIPSEGKSFIATNVAFTFGAHNERTIIIDGDLRMPNVGKSLDIDAEQGFIQVLNGEASLDDVIIRNIEKNTDVLPAGGRTKNPTQMLGSEQFENVLHELRMRYDKIIIDSPPLAPVSDSLTILPLVDGILYVIRYNMVKRKTALVNVRRLRDSNVPLFGAVLNNINTSVAGYYYSHYYDKSYRGYYGGADDADDQDRAEKAEPTKV